MLMYMRSIRSSGVGKFLFLSTCLGVGNRPPRKKKNCKSPGGVTTFVFHIESVFRDRNNRQKIQDFFFRSLLTVYINGQKLTVSRRKVKKIFTISKTVNAVTPRRPFGYGCLYVSSEVPNLVCISEVLEVFSCMTRQKRMPYKTIHEVVDFRSASCLNNNLIRPR